MTQLKPNFIVISGKKQSGKTTSAVFLEGLLTHLGWKVKVTSFAEPIKEFCTDILGLTREQVYGTEEQKNSPTHIKWDTMPEEIRRRYAPPATNSMQAYTGELPLKSGPMTAREVMQIFGTDIFRNFFDYDVWAKAPFNRFAFFHDYDFVIIDDCRFPNEADIALKHGAVLIRLTRDVLGGDQHISEKAMDTYPTNKYTYVIDNQNYEMWALQDALRDIVRHLGLD